jgi:hypothetical protein
MNIDGRRGDAYASRHARRVVADQVEELAGSGRARRRRRGDAARA